MSNKDLLLKLLSIECDIELSKLAGMNLSHQEVIDFIQGSERLAKALAECSNLDGLLSDEE